MKQKRPHPFDSKVYERAGVRRPLDVTGGLPQIGGKIHAVERGDAGRGARDDRMVELQAGSGARV